MSQQEVHKVRVLSLSSPCLQGQEPCLVFSKCSAQAVLQVVPVFVSLRVCLTPCKRTSQNICGKICMSEDKLNSSWWLKKKKNPRPSVISPFCFTSCPLPLSKTELNSSETIDNPGLGIHLLEVSGTNCTMRGGDLPLLTLASLTSAEFTACYVRVHVRAAVGGRCRNTSAGIDRVCVCVRWGGVAAQT